MAFGNRRLSSLRRDLFALPSKVSVILIALSASVLGVFFFPFVFDAFGPRDNPFEKPSELVGLLALASAIFVFLLLIGLARRGLRAIQA